MYRRRFTRRSIQIELFPFLSVLACTIGTLILLIIVVSTQILGNEREVTIIARGETGTNESKTPRYIECQQDGVIIYPHQTFVPLAEIDRPDSALSRLLDEVEKNRDRQYLIVTMRPQGIEVFKRVREAIERRGIDIGYEPLDEGWRLKIEDEIERL
jgi:hypothetical protein